MARRRPRDEDDDFDDDDRFDEDDDDAPPRPKATNNAWTGLLGLSFLAFVAASVLFYLDAEAHTGTVPKPAVTVPALGEAATTPGR